MARRNEWVHATATTAAVAIVCGLAPGVTPALGEAPGPSLTKAGGVIVRFERGVSASRRASTRRAAGVTAVRALRLEGAQLVEPAPGRSVDTVIAALERSPHVRYAEPNRIRRSAARIPDDPRFGEQWALHNLTTGPGIGGEPSIADADIDAPEGWESTVGSEGVIVAVVDSGIAYDHPDLAPNLWSNTQEIAGDGVDDDRNGFVDDVLGVDLADGDTDPRDFAGHGTAVAGGLASAGGNGVGIAGVAWRAQLMAVGVLSHGRTNDALMTDGLDYAGDMGARVVNMSIGGPGRAQVVVDAINEHPGTLFVFPAGNDGTNNDAGPNADYPCSIDDDDTPADNIICVAASDQRDALWADSNYGAVSVDMAAPGDQILNAVPDRGRTRLADGFELDLARWDVSAEGAGAKAWNRTTAVRAAGNASVQDSAGNYVPGTATSLTSKAIDLRGERGCHFRFDRRQRSDDTGSREDADLAELILRISADGSEFHEVWSSAGSTDGAFVFEDVALVAEREDGVDLVADGQPRLFVELVFGAGEDATPMDGVYVDNIAIGCAQPEAGAPEYELASGTSFAAPHVAGAAALLLARKPSLWPAAAKALLMFTGDPLPDLEETTVSGRRLNLAALLGDPSLPPGGPPTVSTGPAADIAHDGATLHGTVDPRDRPTSYRFDFGTTRAYGSATPESVLGGGGATSATARIGGLPPSTRIHFRLVALRDGEQFVGADRVFSTFAPPEPPSPAPAPLVLATERRAPATAPPDRATRIARSARMSCRVRGRQVTCRIRASGRARLSLRLVKGGRTLARGSGRVGAAIRLRLRRRLSPGRYTVVIRVSANGGTATVRRALRVRRPARH